MAKKSIERLKERFSKGMYPTADDFADVFDSFVHQGNGIAIELVLGLAEALNRKLERSEAAAIESTANSAAADSREALRLLREGLDRVSEVEEENRRTRELAESLLGERLEETVEAFAALRDFLDGLEDQEGLAETLDSLRRLIDDLEKQVVLEEIGFEVSEDEVEVTRHGRMLGDGSLVEYTQSLPLPMACGPVAGDGVARPQPGQAGIITGDDYGRFDGAAEFASGLRNETALRDIGFTASEGQVSFTRPRYRLDGGNPWVDGDGNPVAVPANGLWPFPMASVTHAGAITAAQARAIADAPELAFRELWRSAGCSVDETAAPSEMYLCNGLGMSYAEARAVYAAGVMTNVDINARYAGMSIRTHLPSQIRWGASPPAPTTFRGSSVEVVAAPLLTPGAGCFRDCTKLRKASVFSPRGTNAGSDAWAGCKALETLTVAAMTPGSFSLADSPLISLASLRGIISKAWEGMGATTITLHPDTYAKMTDTERETEWTQLPELAAAKNITFTTTE